MDTRVRVGCISWTYADWKGPFYPEKLHADEMLARYAKVFDIVEVENTSYRMPKTEVVQAWCDATPDDFMFSVKLRSSVHDVKNLDDAPRGIEAFLTRLRPIVEAGKLGPIVVLFPPWYKRDKNAEAFEKFVSILPREQKWAIELRSSSWWAPETYAALRDANAALVWGVNDTVEPPPERTADWLYTRFIGERDLEKFDRPQRDMSEAIEDWKKKLGTASGVKDHYVLVSSRFEGYAPETVRKLQGILGAPQAELARAKAGPGQTTLGL